MADIIETAEDDFVNVYGDASYFPPTGTIGVAWIIATHNNPLNPDVYFDRYKLPKQDTPQDRRDITNPAELTAIYFGIMSVPRDKKVRVHCDCKDVLQKLHHTIQTNNFLENTTGAEKAIITKIVDEIKKRPDVIIIYAHETPERESNPFTRYYMAHAHNAAADGSGANSKITVPDPYAPPPTTLPKSKPHDSSGALEIIEWDNDPSNDEPFEYPNHGDQKPRPAGF